MPLRKAMVVSTVKASLASISNWQSGKALAMARMTSMPRGLSSFRNSTESIQFLRFIGAIQVRPLVCTARRNKSCSAAGSCPDLNVPQEQASRVAGAEHTTGGPQIPF
jgi:hypothetical protein